MSRSTLRRAVDSLPARGSRRATLSVAAFRSAFAPETDVDE